MLKTNKMVGLGVLVVSSGAMGAGALSGPPFAGVNTEGTGLVVPESSAGLGRVYHAITGRDRQIYFESDAPLEDIKGQSNRVIGFAVASSGGGLAAGEWHLPIESIRTGIELRDEHLAGKDWLDGGSHPSIVFQLQGTEDVTLKTEKPGFRTYAATLVGEFSIKGVSQAVRIPNATLTFLDESASTRAVAPGDLLAVRAKYSVTLSEFGVSHPVVGDKVADTIEIDTALYLAAAAGS
jgi:polyisoprenoid-binding protein YceI